MNSIKSAAFLAALLLAAAAPAFAQSAKDQEQAEYRRDCTADYSRLCSTFDPGSPQVEQCFQQRFKEVSPRCQATIAKYRKAGTRR